MRIELNAAAIPRASIRNSQFAIRNGEPRGLILPVVLLILALLGLISCSFAFLSNADYAATQAAVERMQTRMAAEAGFQYAALVLRESRGDVNVWYNNPEAFRGVLLWSPTATTMTYGKVEEETRDEKKPTEPAYRFALVADDPLDDMVKVRFGLTDESAKLNINVATAEQLRRLFRKAVPPEIAIEPLVDALIDWRDEDENPGPNGAESEYYRGLPTPYRCKNAGFDTVEELLMVRGFTGQVLYGEDADRNGLLGVNEDDAEHSFPPDNKDGLLSRGIYPYLTVHSRDFNTANDRKPRIPLTAAAAGHREKLEEWFEPDEVEYLIARGGSAGGGGDAGSNGNSNGLDGYTGLLESSTNGPPSPFAVEDLPRILDRCTLNPIPEMLGLINVNTAPPIVLGTLEALTDEEIAAIVVKRDQLSSEAKSTIGWLLIEGILEPDKFDQVADFICARGLQFTSEVVGYADHIGTRTRLQIVFEMRGPMPQILYYRDITNLGVNFPLTLEEEQRAGQRATQL